MLTPPPLVQKDTIALVCPSGYLPKENSLACIQTLEAWGFRVLLGKTMESQHHYFSGTDEERLADLQQMLDNPTVKAILFGRGGYGLSRIIDQIDYTQFVQHPKWLIGFSDITVLHAYIHQHFQIPTLHAPMCNAFNQPEAKESIETLHNAITGKQIAYTLPASLLNNLGTAEGILIGGNLSIIAHLIGSNSAYDTYNKILFLEDVGEYLYNVDRMFIQLERAGCLANLAGLIIGGFTDLKDTILPFGATVFEIIHEYTRSKPYPVCFHFPVSHGKDNYALKIGVEYRLNVGVEWVGIEEV